jgi:hypothetical protein
MIKKKALLIFLTQRALCGKIYGLFLYRRQCQYCNETVHLAFGYVTGNQAELICNNLRTNTL